MKMMGEKQSQAESSSVNAGKIIYFNAANQFTTNGQSTWIIDSSASDHISGNKNLFVKLENVKREILVGLPDGTTRKIVQTGTVKLTKKLFLKEVLYVLEFRQNL